MFELSYILILGNYGIIFSASSRDPTRPSAPRSICVKLIHDSIEWRATIINAMASFAHCMPSSFDWNAASLQSELPHDHIWMVMNTVVHDPPQPFQ